MVDILPYNVLDPGHVCRWASVHTGIFVHDTANRPKAGDTVDFPGGRGVVLTHPPCELQTTSLYNAFNNHLQCVSGVQWGASLVPSVYCKCSFTMINTSDHRISTMFWADKSTLGFSLTVLWLWSFKNQKMKTHYF